MLRVFSLILFFLTLSFPLCADGESGEVVAILREPTFEDGVLSTDQGGVITYQDIRIQAQHISYSNKKVDGKRCQHVEAWGSLMLEFREHVLIGERFSYDFEERHGYVYSGRLAMDPWYGGGETIELLPDNSYLIHDAMITTCPCFDPHWCMTAEKVHVRQDKILSATAVRVSLVDIPIFWLPTFRANLSSLEDIPIEFRVLWGGFQGTSVYARYRFWTGENFKAYAGLQYNLSQGLGGSLDTDYHSSSECTHFSTHSFVARSPILEDPDEDLRYRFEGLFRGTYLDGCLQAEAQYDKLSDEDVTFDYGTRQFNLPTPKQTQVLLRHQTDQSISRLRLRARINDFETVKQELPTLEISLKPWNLWDSGVIGDGSFSLSFLDFKFEEGSPPGQDFHSARIGFDSRLYRPFSTSLVNVTPELGYRGIFYGNSQRRDDAYLGVFEGGISANTWLRKNYETGQHVVQPYADVRFIAKPTIGLDEHFIFDLRDAYSQFGSLRLGFKQSLFQNSASNCYKEIFSADFFASSFFGPSQTPNHLPYLNASLSWNVTPCMLLKSEAIWNTERNSLDVFNLQSRWTLGRDLAFALEYRHRSPFAWRKADHSNYLLDYVRSTEDLLASPLSDKRDLLLAQVYYRLHPDVSIDLKTRYGWNRKLQPNFLEYQVRVNAHISCHWWLHFTYQHREDEDRFGLGLALQTGQVRQAY